MLQGEGPRGGQEGAKCMGVVGRGDEGRVVCSICLFHLAQETSNTALYHI